MANEADTCRKFVVPALEAAGWEKLPHAIQEQRHFTDGRVHVTRAGTKRGKRKRADYLLRYGPDVPIAIVEAKASYKHPADGMQQAKDYAQILGLHFAYSTNGRGIIEWDATTGLERPVGGFPAPDELWERYRRAEGLHDDEAVRRFLVPGRPDPKRPLRYYQEIAVNRAVGAILTGQRPLLLTLCTGAGKTPIAYQICWRLWSTGWNAKGRFGKPKILYLADRNILVDDPKDKDFAPFGDARHKIQGQPVFARDIYFATYQAIARDERRPGLYREYPRDFFDLIIVDECHRGSARDESNWREILEWFEPAVQLGLTATPRHAVDGSTYSYFGEPLYEYSLRQGIDDGFLAPYRVFRVVTDYDATGWRPTPGEADRYGREIPDELYGTPDFERTIALKARTRAIAKHLSGFLRATDPYGKTIVFCVDQEHALELRQALIEQSPELCAKHNDYVCRVTADEAEIGRGHLGRFQDVDTQTPVILTTSQLLTTGVDVPTCRNVVLVRMVGTMAEFKQIIGRGTRLRKDYGKLSFSILDYTGTAVEKFADPTFDGDPVLEGRIEVDAEGEVVDEETLREEDEPGADGVGDEAEVTGGAGLLPDDEQALPRKLYVDDGEAKVVVETEYVLGADGRRLTLAQFKDYAAEAVRTLYTTADDLREIWRQREQREALLEELAERGIDLDQLAEAAGIPDADPYDVLAHVAYGAPGLSRRERAERVRRGHRALFDRLRPEAREVLGLMLDKYADHGPSELKIPDALKVPPISDLGTTPEIISRFGSARMLRAAVDELTAGLYDA